MAPVFVRMLLVMHMSPGAQALGGTYRTLTGTAERHDAFEARPERAQYHSGGAPSAAHRQAKAEPLPPPRLGQASKKVCMVSAMPFRLPHPAAAAQTK